MNSESWAREMYRVLRATAGVMGLTKLRIRNRTVAEWAAPFARRLLWRFFGGGHRAVTIRGHHMHLPAGDIFLVGEYEPKTTELFCRIVKQGMRVVDVGANVGYYTLLAARLAGAAGKVYAFEPEPLNYKLLARNIERNGYKNVIAVQKAVTNKSGTAEFYLNREAGTHSLYQNSLAPSVGRIVVPTVALDDFLQDEGWPEINIVKMDIEGGEPAAIDGMAGLFRRARQLRLFIEFDPTRLEAGGTNARAFLDKLQQNLRVRFILDDLRDLNEVNLDKLLAQCKGGRGFNLFCEQH